MCISGKSISKPVYAFFLLTVYDLHSILHTAIIAQLVNDITNSPPSGIYEIGADCPNLKLPFSRSFPGIDARCDMDTDRGGWLVIQRRVSGGTENFFRGWSDYEDGFGDLNGEFWYGLKNIHCLTTRGDVELRIDLKNDNGTAITWTYQVFKVGGPEGSYLLTVGGGEGTTSYDALFFHNNLRFSTHDRDNDLSSSGNCATNYKGGWWFRQCLRSNLNGPHDGSSDQFKVTWHDDSNFAYFPNEEMKIRPKTCAPQKTCT